MKKVFFGILYLLLVQTVYSQEEFITPSKFLTRFGFRQLNGGIIIVNGRFANFPDTLNFILDTGSGGISLDSLTVAYFKLKPTPSDKTIRGIAGVRQVSFLNNQKLHLPNLTIDSLNFHVNDYDILTSVYGEKIDGIIGYSVLSRYVLKINYDSSIIEFWTRGTLKYPRGGYLLKPFINTLPVQSARIKDAATINTRFLYDMGAGLCMLLSTDFVKDSAVLSKKRKLFTKEAQGLGGKIEMQTTVIKEVKIGPYRFRKVPVYIFNDEFNVTSYPYLGGLIGNDLLRRFNVIMNYDKRDIYITPNSHYNDPFDYAYSGIELYYIDGNVVVGDIAKGSPAALSGIEEGDVIIAVNRVFNQSLQAYKAALQGGTEKARVIVNRKGKLLNFEFKVKSIL